MNLYNFYKLENRLSKSFHEKHIFPLPILRKKYISQTNDYVNNRPGASLNQYIQAVNLAFNNIKNKNHRSIACFILYMKTKQIKSKYAHNITSSQRPFMGSVFLPCVMKAGVLTRFAAFSIKTGASTDHVYVSIAKATLKTVTITPHTTYRGGNMHQSKESNAVLYVCVYWRVEWSRV